MKFVFWALGLVVLLLVIILGTQQLASERIEVVELLTFDETGEQAVTRLWVVDDEGYQYLRVGSDGSGWFSRLQANGEFQVTRGTETGRYTAVLRADKSERINELMQNKYTWGDTFIGYVAGSREGSVPIELHPVL